MGSAVYKSTDAGETWSEVGTVPWSDSAYHRAFTLGSFIYGVGISSGKLASWKTSDGATWTSVATDCNIGLQLQRAWCMHGSSIICSGGTTGGAPIKTVYSSTDFSTWSTVAASPAFPTVYDHKMVSDGTYVYLTGGRPTSGNANDVYRSADNGATWTKVATAASFGDSGGFQLFGFASIGSKIYVIGGEKYDSGNWTPTNEVWSSSDLGVNWSQEAEPDWSAVGSFAIGEFGDGIVMAGGIDASSSPVLKTYRFQGL